MATMGDYRDLIARFLETKIHIPRENLKPIEIYGLTEEFEAELQHSYLPGVIGKLLKVKGIIVAYDVNPDNNSFKYINREGKPIGVTIKPEKGNGEIGISEDGIEKRWSCLRNNTGDVTLYPLALGIIDDPISVNRKFEKGKAAICVYDRRNTLSIEIKKDSVDNEFYLLPHENELVEKLTTLESSLAKVDLSETCELVQDITGLNFNKLNTTIVSSQNIGPNKNILSKVLIDKEESPVFSMSLPAPNDKVITYTITDTNNGHVNIAIETICGIENTTVIKQIKSSLSVTELQQFLIRIIKNGKIKRRD